MTLLSYIGYNLPTKHYLYTDPSNAEQFLLRQNFGFPIDDVAVAENFTVKVVLPEGAFDIKVLSCSEMA